MLLETCNDAETVPFIEKTEPIVLQIACSKYGLAFLKKVIKCVIKDSNKRFLVKEMLKNTQFLMRNEFGNIALQEIIKVD